ncbi:MAG TPA: Gfo/Idh/MocA family oxidoreductase [Gemmataceae bacterium]|nr:Gfo/Idh/MocA family oxidoreductase [Gemmataceae bacterium]
MGSPSLPLPDGDRRTFLKSAVAAGVLAGAANLSSGVFAGEKNTLKIGLVGCGGRGTGAASEALNADPDTRLYAMADAFDDRLGDSLARLQKMHGSRVEVPKERQFSGFDGYKHVIDACDVVLLATPPHFRPIHLAYCVEKGKHTFFEKPVAVDITGVRSVIKSAQAAKEKNICLMSGFCYRYDYGKRETIKRIHDGAIGDVLTMHVNYLTGPLWFRGNDPKWSDMEYQMRNWYYYTWLSGDFIVEQHVHNMDKAAWVMNGKMPVSAYGLGGRQVRTDKKYGNIYDHHAVVFEYGTGVTLFSYCRQMAKCLVDVSDHIVGSKGTSQLMKHQITGQTNWAYAGKDPSMYQVEHNELFAAIRAGKVINDGESAAYSSLMAIMGRMATYTGQRVEWDWLLHKSKEDLSPPVYEMNASLPEWTRTIAMPGTTKLL